MSKTKWELTDAAETEPGWWALKQDGVIKAYLRPYDILQLRWITSDWVEDILPGLDP